MIEELECTKSQVTILGHPLICRFCTHDEFIPYHTFSNVEDPGIGVFHVGYSAVCVHCGIVTEFGDPSGPSKDGMDYVWAFEQTIV